MTQYTRILCRYVRSPAFYAAIVIQSAIVCLPARQLFHAITQRQEAHMSRREHISSWIAELTLAVAAFTE